MPFLDSLDIANRALQHCGVNPILSVTEDTTNNNEVSAVYDKVRRAELRRNAWRFAIRKTVIRPVTTTMLEINPGLYNATQIYMQGELVIDANNLIWLSAITDNQGNTPGGNNSAWEMYFGPMTCDLWSPIAGNLALWVSTTSYASQQQVAGTDNNIYVSIVNGNIGNNPVTDGGVHWTKIGTLNNTLSGYLAGDLVYMVDTTVAQGYKVYMSITNNNNDTPNVAQAYSSAVQYMQDSIVSYAGSNWRSLSPMNINNTPGVGSSFWTNSPALVTQDTNWRYLTCSLKNLFLSWPIGAGPTNQTTTKNIYRLPAGYVGEAPQNPKQGIMSFLGGPTGNNQPDWELNGNFLITTNTTAIIYRFVADITRVTAMDDMFCEGLACRIASMVCKRLTGSGELLQQINQQYKLFMGEARVKNGIELGTTEPYEDDYITVRI